MGSSWEMGPLGSWGTGTGNWGCPGTSTTSWVWENGTSACITWTLAAATGTSQALALGPALDQHWILGQRSNGTQHQDWELGELEHQPCTPGPPRHQAVLGHQSWEGSRESHQDLRAKGTPPSHDHCGWRHVFQAKTKIIPLFCFARGKLRHWRGCSKAGWVLGPPAHPWRWTCNGLVMGIQRLNPLCPKVVENVHSQPTNIHPRGEKQT